ncbi:MAG TPA: alanine racemase [Thermoanaerobaculaceae bacterium]|nr:alanine racemase [Thermoanaerobaculaceae bacterium]HPS78189.1 alanine racemase [Thermoanaerobaculaceae bacterium]
MIDDLTNGLTTWMEVSESALRHNLSLFRGLVPNHTRVLAVVKANAYGHGLELVARICIAEGVEMLGVHGADEVLALRRAGIAAPVLVMGYLTPAQVEVAVDPEVEVLVSTPEVLDALAAQSVRLGQPLGVHLKVDTGTHRQGIGVGEAGAFAQAALARGLRLAGIATHFANIEDTTDHTFAYRQLARFCDAVESVRAFAPGVVAHAACSAAALLFRETDFGMVRVGISLYGHWPSKETYLSWLLAHGREGVRLEPTLRWRARIGQLKQVPAGEPIGYGLTFRPTRATRLAVIPVGYADGYPRALSNRARVLIHGRPAPIAGRVCMDIFMIDVTDVPSVGIGDVVTLVGRDGSEQVTVEELAELAGTINYEILARLSPLVPRLPADQELSGSGDQHEPVRS